MITPSVVVGGALIGLRLRGYRLGCDTMVSAIFGTHCHLLLSQPLFADELSKIVVQLIDSSHSAQLVTTACDNCMRDEHQTISRSRQQRVLKQGMRIQLGLKN